MANGSWALAEELYTRGDSAFVAELRRICDAERLGAFAARWLADPRPVARQFLLDYLSQPLNCYRHEALVKRLFKGAENSGDDELMGLFLVMFDRSIRRARRTRNRFKYDNVPTRAEAEARVREWEALGYQANFQSWSGRFHVNGSKSEEVIVLPGRTTMPRPPEAQRKKSQRVADWQLERMARRFVLFSVPTRRYMRRRAWRYFRKLALTQPDRYRAAAVVYLKRYADTDVDSDIHLLDNWGLVHTLFGDSPALVRPAKGWEFAPERSLADLAPAPRFASVWVNAPEALFDLLIHANSRTVRQWSAWMLRSHQPEWLARRPVDVILPLIDHADGDLAAFGFELLEAHPDLASVPIDAWLKRLDGDDLERLQRLSSLLARRLDPSRVSLPDAVRLTMHRSLPIARLGLLLLRGRAIAESELPVVLQLAQAESESLRPEVAGWLRDTLAPFGPPRAEWLLEFLDSMHRDVRSIGWNWLLETPLKDEPSVWHKLLESPYDDIRGPLTAELTKHAQGADRDTIRLLWASVLLNAYGAGRHKPGVVAQVVSRLTAHPDEADRLLPLLALAVRSLRGPEFRTGLTGVVGLVEHQPDLRPAIEKQFPELILT